MKIYSIKRINGFAPPVISLGDETIKKMIIKANELGREQGLDIEEISKDKILYCLGDMNMETGEITPYIINMGAYNEIK